MKVARLGDGGKVLALEERADDAALGADEILVDERKVGIALAHAIEAAHWRYDAEGKRFEELPFKAMLLDAADVYVELVELASTNELTAQHVDLRLHGGDCDREPGRYRWDRQKLQLVPLPKPLQRPAQAGGVSLERAIADFWAQLEHGGVTLPKSTRAWLEQFRGSHYKG